MASGQLTLAGLVVRTWVGCCQGEQTCCEELGNLHDWIEEMDSLNMSIGGVWTLALCPPGYTEILLCLFRIHVFRSLLRQLWVIEALATSRLRFWINRLVFGTGILASLRGYGESPRTMSRSTKRAIAQSETSKCNKLELIGS